MVIEKKIKLIINENTEIKINPGKKIVGRKDKQYYPDIDLSAYDSEHFVSRKHGSFYYDSKNLIFSDCSKNGTVYNGETINFVDRIIHDQDELIFGNIKTKIFFEEN